MKLIRFYHADMLNGEGLREVVFLSGCSHHCPGCFSPETWDPDTPLAHTWTKEDEDELFSNLKKPYISGVTFSGGDPLSEWNCIELYSLLKRIKENFPEKTIWVYTGFTWENLLKLKHTDCMNKVFSYLCLEFIDVLCEGPYIQSMKSPTKPWVGSENQRVINVQESLTNDKIVLYE